MDEYIITACGLTGRIYRTMSHPDRYSFQLCDRFYHWSQPLVDVLPKAKEQMIRVATVRINNEFKQLQRRINKQTK